MYPFQKGLDRQCEMRSDCLAVGTSRKPVDNHQAPQDSRFQVDCAQNRAHSATSWYWFGPEAESAACVCPDGPQMKPESWTAIASVVNAITVVVVVPGGTA